MLRLFSVLLFCVMSFYTSIASSDGVDGLQLPPLVKQLPNTKLNQLAPLIDQIASTKAPQVRSILQQLKVGELYYIKSNQQVVHAQKNQQKDYQLTDILTGELLPTVKKST